MRESIDPVRRRLLGEGASLAGAFIAVVALTRCGAAYAKAAKTQMQYQGHPREGKSCASCRFFAAAPGDKGSCALVEGEVSRDGWCVAYAARTASRP